MARGLTRLAAEITGATAPGNDVRCWVEPAVVKAAVSGYFNDVVLTVTWRGTDVACSYLASYTPAEGDTVALLIQPGSTPIVLDKLIGPPTDEDTGE